MTDWVGLGGRLAVQPNVVVSRGAIHSTKIPTGATGKSGPPQMVDPFFRNFSGWTEPLSFGPKFPEILVEWIAP